MEAQKLKKKLNGSILKGQKVRIEEARPEKRKRPEDEDGAEEKQEKKPKKTKREKGVLEGYELGDGRKVKRGWTETPAEKRKNREGTKDKRHKKEKEGKAKRESSKYTSEPECLFRTTLPPNVKMPQEEKKHKKDKKSKREVVVHEFENTTKQASFLRGRNVGTTGKVVAEYVEGRGWVDADDAVVEKETESQREKREKMERKGRKKAEKLAKKQAQLVVEEADQLESHADKRSNHREKRPVPTSLTDHNPIDEVHDANKAHEELATASSAVDNAPQHPSTSQPEVSEKVHPLEALFKRPKLPSLDMTPNVTPKDSAFSFFSGEGHDSDIEDEGQDVVTDLVPQTPFTEQDMEWRGVRSAAPTPDTAAIGRKFSFSIVDRQDDEDEEQGAEGGAESSKGMGLGISNGDVATEENNGGERDESEFARWFYEHRSENNKRWRQRRRDAMKLKRKRENRRLTRRIV